MNTEATHVTSNIVAVNPHRFAIGDQVRHADTIRDESNRAEIGELTFRAVVGDNRVVSLIATYTIIDRSLISSDIELDEIDPAHAGIMSDIVDNADLIAF